MKGSVSTVTMRGAMHSSYIQTKKQVKSNFWLVHVNTSNHKNERETATNRKARKRERKKARKNERQVESVAVKNLNTAHCNTLQLAATHCNSL